MKYINYTIAIILLSISSLSHSATLLEMSKCEKAHEHVAKNIIVPSYINNVTKLFMLDVSLDKETGECRAEFLYRVDERDFIDSFISAIRKNKGITYTYAQIAGFFNSPEGRKLYISERKKSLKADRLYSELKKIHPELVFEMTYYFSDDTPESIQNISHVMR